MNDRLKELMIQAGYAAPEIAKRGQLLAELVIKECINRINRVGILEDIENETDMVVNAIEEHFGVR